LHYAGLLSVGSTIAQAFARLRTLKLDALLRQVDKIDPSYKT
jgi:hypothetical protein